MPLAEAEVVRLLGEMVAIPSVNPAFRRDGEPEHWFGEAALGDYVAEWLRRIGLDVEIDTVLPGRPNVIARLEGRPRARHLLWEAHLDTVQVSGMTVDPFKPMLRDGRLYGRGAVDNKGCLAAFMLAMQSLVANPPACGVTFVAAVDEEFQFKGIVHHLARGEHYDFGIAGEPTELRIVRACKGCVRWTIDIAGKSAHTSKPQEGIDAIEIAQDLLRYLRGSGDRRRYPPPAAGRIDLHLHDVPGGRRAKHRACLGAPDIYWLGIVGGAITKSDARPDKYSR